MLVRMRIMRALCAGKPMKPAAPRRKATKHYGGRARVTSSPAARSSFQPRLVFDGSSLTRWRMSEEKLQASLQESL